MIVKRVHEFGPSWCGSFATEHPFTQSFHHFLSTNRSSPEVHEPRKIAGSQVNITSIKSGQSRIDRFPEEHPSHVVGPRLILEKEFPENSLGPNRHIHEAVTGLRLVYPLTQETACL